jgi:hypothetical protein
MSPYVTFETAVQFLTLTYATSTIIIMLVAQICLAALEITETNP